MLKTAHIVLSIIFLFFFLCSAKQASAASRYWVGSGTGLWNDVNNWADADPASCTGGGATVPGSDDVAYFDADCDYNASMNTAIDVKGINIATGYGGEISPASSITIAVGTTGFVQAGGTFTSTEGVLTLSGNFTKSGGTFNEGTGTVTFAGMITTFNVDSQETFYNVRLNKGGGTFVTYITDNDTMIVTGTLTLDNGFFASSDTYYLGKIDLRGNAIQNSTADSGSADCLRVDFGNNDVAQTYTINGGYGPVLYFDNASDANDSIIFNASGTLDGLIIKAAFGDNAVPINYNGNGEGPYNLAIDKGYYYQEAGTFTAPTTLTLSNGGFTKSGGNFEEGTGTVVFGGGAIERYNVDGTETFYNLTVSTGGNTYSLYFTDDSDKLVVTGTLNLTNGTTANGTFEAQGNVTVASTFDSGTTELLFSGSNTQSFDLTGATGLFDADIAVNKSGGAVNLASALVMNVSGQDLTVQNGTFDLSGNNLTVDSASNNGKLIVNSGGNLQLQGGETITAESGYPQLDSGSTVTYDGTSGPYTLKDYTYSNLTINGTGATFNLPSTKSLANLTITAGTLDATASNYNLTISGAWSNSGVFTPELGTVTFPTGTHTLTGATTFYNLTIDANNAITFPASTTQTIGNTLTCSGTAGNLITINSSSPGTKAVLSKASGTVSCDYMALTDNSAVGGAVWHTGVHSTATNYDGWLDLNVAPNIPVLVSPTNASYTVDNTPTLSANYSDPDTGDVGTTDYRIATSAVNCTGGTTVASGTSSATPDNNENTTWTPDSSIGSNGTYYWCARNDDGVAQSAWTSMGNFILDTVTPDIVALDAGASSGDRTSLTSGTWFKYSGTGSDDQISFLWTDPSSVSDDTFYYELNASSGDTITGNESTTTNPYVDSIAITEGTNYFHVRPKNGAGAWGTERIFTIKYDKTNPSVNAGVDQTKNAQFTQNAVTSDATSGVASYLWEKVSGTGTITFGTATAEDTTISSDTDGTFVVRLTATDTAGNTNTDNFTLVWHATAPVISTLSPANGATNVSETVNLTITFDEAVNVGTGNITIKKVSDNSVVETINVAGVSVAGSGTATISVTRSVVLESDLSYYVTIDATAFDDLYGNSFVGVSDTAIWRFTIRTINSAPQVTDFTDIVQASDGTGHISFNIGVSDADNEKTALKIEYSTNNRDWSKISAKEIITSRGTADINNDAERQVSSIETDGGKVTLTVVWDALKDLEARELSEVYLRAVPNDGTIDGSVKTSDKFSFDGRAPQIVNLNANRVSDSAITLGWSVSENEANFSEYVVCIGTSQGSADKCNDSWNSVSDNNLLKLETNQTKITDLLSDTTYFFVLKAGDNYGNEKTLDLGKIVTLVATDQPTLTSTPAPTQENESGNSNDDSGVENLIMATPTPRPTPKPLPINIPKLEDIVKKLVPTPFPSLSQNISVPVDVLPRLQEIYFNPLKGAFSVLIQDQNLRKINYAVTTLAVLSSLSALSFVSGLVSVIEGLPLLFKWLIHLVFGIFSMQKKRRPWGKVLDYYAGTPISKVLVLIIDAKSGKVKAQEFSDENGYFSSFLPAGEYLFQIRKNGWDLSAENSKIRLSKNEHYYNGQPLIVREETIVDLVLIAKPTSAIPSILKQYFLFCVNRFEVFLNAISWFVILLGFAINSCVFFNTKSTASIIFFIFYVIIAVTKFYISGKFKQTLGLVCDKKTSEGLGLAVVRLYDVDTNRLVATKVTTETGKFLLLTVPGKYNLTVTKEKYRSQIATHLVVQHNTKALAMKVEMEEG